MLKKKRLDFVLPQNVYEMANGTVSFPHVFLHNILKDVVRHSTLGKLFNLKFEADDFAKGKSLINDSLLFLHQLQSGLSIIFFPVVQLMVVLFSG